MSRNMLKLIEYYRSSYAYPREQAMTVYKEVNQNVGYNIYPN